MHLAECFLVACICCDLSQGIRIWFSDAPVVGNGYGVVELLYLCLCMELPYCLVGDHVSVVSFAESEFSALPVGVEFAGLAVPAD